MMMNVESPFPRFRLVLPLCVAVCCAMAAAHLQWRTVFFPEMLALLGGLLLVREIPWHVSPARFLLCMTVGAAVGAVLAEMPGAPFLRLCLGLCCAGGLMFGLRVNLTPVISAILLPVMLEEGGVGYVVGVAGLSGLTVLLRFVCRGRFPVFVPAVPISPLFMFRRWGMILLLGVMFFVLAGTLGLRYAVVPPLWVAAVAFMDRLRPERRKAIRVMVQFAVAFCLGAGIRWGCARLGWGMVPAVGLTTLTLMGIYRMTGFFFPPTVAAALLAFLIPQEDVWAYAWQGAIGAVALLSAARWLARKFLRD